MYLGGEATTFPFFLDFKEEGFGFFGGEDGVVTGEYSWASCSVRVAATFEVTTNEEPTVFPGKEKGDLEEASLDDLKASHRRSIERHPSSA